MFGLMLFTAGLEEILAIFSADPLQLSSEMNRSDGLHPLGPPKKSSMMLGIKAFKHLILVASDHRILFLAVQKSRSCFLLRYRRLRDPVGV